MELINEAEKGYGSRRLVRSDHISIYRSLHPLPEIIDSLLSTTVALIYFAIFWLIRKTLTVAVVFWSSLRLVRLIRRYPYISIFIGHLVTLAGSYYWNICDRISLQVALAVCMIAALGLYAIAVMSILRSVSSTMPEAISHWFARRLKNPSDILYVKSIFEITVIVLPAFLGLLSRPTLSFFTASTYLILIFRTSAAQQNLIHTDVHYHIFRRKHLRSRRDAAAFYLLNAYLKYVVPLMFCRAPHRYGVDHVMMHHVEDNGIYDTHSTVWYDRTSFVDYCKFGLRRCVDFVSWGESYAYFRKRKRRKAIRTLLYSQLVWYSFVVAVCFFNIWAAAVMVAVSFFKGFPSATSIFFWHGLVDARNIDNVFTNTVNIDASFHDARHIDHHLHPGANWTILPHVANRAAVNYEQECTIMYAINYDLPYLFLKGMWMRRFDLLASLCVPTCPRQQNCGELAKIIEERTMPIVLGSRSVLSRKIDAWLGRVIATYVLPGDFRRARRRMESANNGNISLFNEIEV